MNRLLDYPRMLALLFLLGMQLWALFYDSDWTAPKDVVLCAPSQTISCG